jgi:hypothetical protein
MGGETGKRRRGETERRECGVGFGQGTAAGGIAGKGG